MWGCSNRKKRPVSMVKHWRVNRRSCRENPAAVLKHRDKVIGKNPSKSRLSRTGTGLVYLANWEPETQRGSALIAGRAKAVTGPMRVTRELVITVLLVLSACGERPESENRGQAAVNSSEKKPTKPLVSRDFEQGQREEYKIQLKALRDGYLKSVEELKTKAQQPGAEITSELESVLADVEEKTKTVSKIAEKLDAASLESWQELKPDIHAALDDLEMSYDKAVSRLKDLDEEDLATHPRAATPKQVVRVRESR